jgi:hypothetical protein
MDSVLPGEEILVKGLKDLEAGRVTEDALLLRIGAARLAVHGIRIPPRPVGSSFPEDELYELLSRKHGAEGYSRYNSLLRKLVSLENALDAVANR